MNGKRMRKLISVLTAMTFILASFTGAFSVAAEEQLYTISKDDVIKAILYNHAEGVEEPENVAEAYDVTSSLSEEGEIEVVITATGVKLHTNNADDPAEGYWVGFAVKAPEEVTHAEGTFGGVAYPDESVYVINEDGDKGIAFYVNAGALSSKSEATITWYNDENAVSEEATFIINTDSVTLDVNYSVDGKIYKAIVADKNNQERNVYDASSYIVSYDAGVVDIDMEKLELHKNAGGTEGFWTGFSVEAPEDASFAKYTFGETTDTENVTDIDGEAGDKKGIAFYSNAVNPKTDVKLQWFDENSNALSNLIEFTINLDDVEYYHIDSENDITEAILKDNAEEPITTLFREGTYNVDAEQGEGVINVSIAAENVVKHKNGEDAPKDGYWVGFAVKAPEDAAKADVKFREYEAIENVTDIDGTGTPGIAFYINAGDENPKTEATLQWLDENDETLCEKTSFNIDLSGVTLSIDYTPVIAPAKVVDSDATERVIYKADSYTVNSTTKNDGTILVDIAMQELAEHTNGGGDEGYWTGFAVEAPEDADGMKYALGTSMELALSDVKSLEANVIDEKDGIAFYANMADAEPIKYAKLQWYKGTEAISNVMTFEMSFDEVKLNWIKADKISAAIPLIGQVTPQAVATQNDDVITVALTAEDVSMHLNEDTTPKEGYWVGFAVEAPKNDAKAEVSFGGVSYGIIPLEDISDSKKGIAFYTDAGALESKTEATLRWFANDGVTPLCAPTKFVVDIGGVTLAELPYITADKVEKANVVDQANTSVQPYGTYTATASANENGIIVVDIDMTDLKSHESNGAGVGHWTGFSVTAPEGAISMRYAFSQTREELSSMQKADLNGEGQVSFYANKSDTQPKKFVRLQWFDENGVAITNATDFEMDLSGVQLYVAPQPSRGGGGSRNYYTVIFNSNGGSNVSSAKVKKESIVSAPEAPTKDGFVFEGWYTDKELTEKYDFSSEVTKSFTLYAKWTEKEPEAETTTQLKFTDVDKEAWYYGVIKTAVEKGLMNGISEAEFAPEKEVTRAMFVTILYRLAGEPDVEDFAEFKDVSADKYYAKAVAWASAKGIITGITDKLFAPDTNITREQMAVMIYRYMKADKAENTAIYTDKNLISEYALDAINWANASGIMKGNEDGSFAPLRNSTRAEAAAVFARLLG